MKYVKTIILVALFVGGTLSMFAQNSFKSWDSDKDGYLEKHEFTSKFMDKYFSMWSEDANKMGIIEEGFFKKSYAGLDTDNDRMLSDEEWLLGYNYFYNDYLVYKDVDIVDVNNDGTVSFKEYYDVIYDTHYFTDVDLDNDNYISEYELAEFVFNNWDKNDNGFLSKYEFDRFKQYYLDVQ